MTNSVTANRRRDVYTVSRLNREARRLLESGLPMLHVEGEISNLATPASGHWYFSLKDADAQIRCAMFRGRNRLIKLRPQNGTQVIVRGRVSLYEPRGDYQLIAEHLRESGEGALQLAFDKLKERLLAEGLFDNEHKKPLPTLPTRIGVITSPSGAAVRDVLKVLARRFPGIPVRIYPVPVQGETAAPAIVAALELAGERRDCDVLILARGGGSLEDLWPFNEEIVARALFACPLPVVSAVGHETDVTISDFVADLRAPTPSAAAEQVVPDAAELERALAATGARLMRVLRATLAEAASELRWLAKRHRQNHPGRLVTQVAQRLDHLDRRLMSGLALVMNMRRQSLQAAGARLTLNSPHRRLERFGNRTQTAGRKLVTAIRRSLSEQQARLTLAARSLATVGPQATLARGYAIVSRERDGAIATSAAQLEPKERVHMRLAHGEATATIDKTKASR